MGENIVAISHIYVAKAIFLLFRDIQDTESESRYMEIDVARPIFIHENIKVFKGEQNPHSSIWK